MTTGRDAPAAGFHRAAATVLRDASSPDDVAWALALVRRVVLGPDAASPAEDDEVFAGSSSSSRALASECAAASEACAASKNPAAARWTGFDAVGEEMLHAVAPRWLPLMRSERRRALHDEILAAMPPMTAIRVLVPALAPSSTTAGRDLDDAGKTAVATEAARALAAALERGIARRLVSNLEPGQVDEATRSCAALFSAADRLELSPGSHGCAAALHPAALARTVAAQLCDAARHSCAPATGPRHSCDRRRRRVGARVSPRRRRRRRRRPPRRRDRLLHRRGTTRLGERVDRRRPRRPRRRQAGAGLARSMRREALGVARVRASVSRGVFRSIRSVRVDEARRVRRDAPAPTPAPGRAPGADSRRAGGPAAGHHQSPGGPRRRRIEEEEEASEAAARDRHRATTATACVDAWSQLELVRGGSGALQGHVAAVVAASLAAGALIGGSIAAARAGAARLAAVRTSR